MALLKTKTLFIRGGRKGEAIKPHLTLIKWLISFWGRISDTVRCTLNPFTYKYIRKTIFFGFKKVYFFSKKKLFQPEEPDIQ